MQILFKMHESERIKSVAKHYGSQQKFATILGTTQSNVANWIQRGSLSSKAIRMIATNCPEISLDWLTTGNGDMIIDTPGHGDFAASHNNGRCVAVKAVGNVASPGSRTSINRRAAVPVKIHDFPELILGGDQSQAVPFYFQKIIGQMAKDVRASRPKKGRCTVGIGQRKLNALLKEAIEKLQAEIASNDSGIQLTPYEINEDTRLAVVPVQKEVDSYITVEETTMSPTINKGDVIGVTSTDWFETFSEKYIYLLRLQTGEVLIRRIVPPENNDDENITLVSDNPEEDDRVISRRELADLKRIIYIGKNI